MAFFDQVLLDGGVVFNNAIADDRQAAVVGVMRMGVHIVWFTVRSPAGVAYPDRRGKLLSCLVRFEICYFSLLLVNIQFSVFEQGNS